MPFPLSRLPLELALEILRLAASPDIQYDPQSSPHTYQSAITLARVSYDVRQVIMPHFLHIVIFRTQESIDLFIRTLEQQQYFATAGSRLQLDYTRLVRRTWSTQYHQPLVESTDYPRSYCLLRNIFSNAEIIGFNTASLHLLYETLGGTLENSSPAWNCRRLTLAGEGLRWNPLTSTSAGLAFLKRLTHLTIWSPTNDTFGSDSAPGGVPNWVRRVPFEFMPNLSHFAFSLVTYPGSAKVKVLVYMCPKDPYSTHENSTKFRDWASSATPLDYGSLSYDVGVSPSYGNPILGISWETAYLQGENDT